MYHAAGRLPHLLRPDAYHSAEQHEREQARIFRRAWRLAGTLDELPRHGDFLTMAVDGAPLILRNLRGEIRAFSNVCAHRHCLLRQEGRGRALELSCPYHGWRYNDAGQVTASRGQEHFRAAGAGRPALRRYRTALCGRLIFVRLEEPGPSLETFMGELYEVCAERFGDDYRPTLAMDLDYPVNWKAPVENSLEGYHAPTVHPRTFGGDPSEARSDHVLGHDRTVFTTRFISTAGPLHRRAYLKLQAMVLSLTGETPTGEYRHVHLFPNLTFAFTEGVSVVQTMEPVSPARSRGMVRQFGLHRRTWPWWRRACMAVSAHVSARVTRRIVGEDMALYPALQAGFEGSPHPGMLGRQEERIHAFQAWLLQTLWG